MRLARFAWIAPAALLLLALIPASGATAPVNGVVTTCASSAVCAFSFNTSAGTGWASVASSGKLISFQLPGEAKASYNLSYSTYVGSLIGTYTYWTVGNFYGTDVNTGNVVYGTTDTNFTITAHCQRGCTYTYTTDNGTIVFHFTKAELTSTSVSCSPTSINVSAKTTCKVTVANLWNSSNSPVGKVRLSTAGLGTFSSKGVCTLSAGSCSLTFRPGDNTVGSVLISVSYAGTSAFYKSASSTSITVNGGG